MKRAFFCILIFFISCVLLAQTENPGLGKERFIKAKVGEIWRINDDYTYILKYRDHTYDNWQYIFRNKYSLTWHDVLYTIDMIGKYKHVFILKSEGYAERWKYVRYGRIKDSESKKYYGWILATTVENAMRVKNKKEVVDIGIKGYRIKGDSSTCSVKGDGSTRSIIREHLLNVIAKSIEDSFTLLGTGCAISFIIKGHCD
jgi:hypothetical protein